MFIRSCGTQDGSESKEKVRVEYERIMSMVDPKVEWNLTHTSGNETVAPTKRADVSSVSLQRPSSPVLLRPRPTSVPTLATSTVSHVIPVDGGTCPVSTIQVTPVADDMEVYDCHGAVNIDVLIKLVKRLI